MREGEKPGLQSGHKGTRGWEVVLLLVKGVRWYCYW